MGSKFLNIQELHLLMDEIMKDIPSIERTGNRKATIRVRKHLKRMQAVIKEARLEIITYQKEKYEEKHGDD